jgi:hypothetical protein
VALPVPTLSWSPLGSTQCGWCHYQLHPVRPTFDITLWKLIGSIVWPRKDRLFIVWIHGAPLLTSGVVTQGDSRAVTTGVIHWQSPPNQTGNSTLLIDGLPRSQFYWPLDARPPCGRASGHTTVSVHTGDSLTRDSGELCTVGFRLLSRTRHTDSPFRVQGTHGIDSPLKFVRRPAEAHSLWGPPISQSDALVVDPQTATIAPKADTVRTHLDGDHRHLFFGSVHCR